VTSGPIREMLAHDSFDCPLSTLHIVYIKADAVAVAKLILRKISVQVPFAAMLVDANHAALEDRKEAFFAGMNAGDDRFLVGLSPMVGSLF
jgi:hypothetical protein